jgi:hypothetical protein
VGFGQVGEGGEDGAGAIDDAVGEAEEGGDGVDDDESEVGDGLKGLGEGFKGVMSFCGVSIWCWGEGGEAFEVVDAGEVGAGGFEARADGVGRGIFGGEEQGGLRDED